MSEHGKAFQEARTRKTETSKSVYERFIENKYAWDYGFCDGWDEAMDAKFDDRKVLSDWHRASKHLDCPCNEEERCVHTCPHGLMIMSGVCIWCIEKFEEMEKEGETSV